MSDKPQTLYRFFDAAGSLLYIGVTQNGAGRIQQHNRDKDWWPQVATATFETYPDRDAVLRAEANAIRAERPRYNVQHNGRAKALTARQRRVRSDWVELTRLEPTLLDLEQQASRLRANGYRRASDGDERGCPWYGKGGLRSQMSYLVGWLRHDPGGDWADEVDYLDLAAAPATRYTWDRSDEREVKLRGEAAYNIAYTYLWDTLWGEA